MFSACASLMLLNLIVAQQPDAAPADADRQDRLRAMKEKASELALYWPGGDIALPLTPEPVLRYSNAEREIGSLDGAMFLWLAGTRPVAAASFSIRRLNNMLYCECASFSSNPLESRGTALNWSPKTGGLLRRPLPDSPIPAEGKPQRLTQMRNFARRFTAICYNPRSDEPTELRLLTQPVYRYADGKQGIVDGGLFAFVVSNDPELLLLLEAASEQPGGEPRWRFSLTRMSSLREVVKLDEKEIWTVPNYYRDPVEDRKTGPYIEARVGTFVPSGGTPPQ